MAYTVILEGGSPWGFRLEGGSEFNEPLRIAKVRIAFKNDTESNYKR